MAWTSEDQNPTTAPTYVPSSVNYAAQLNSAAYYNPLSGGSASTGMAVPVQQGGGTNYAEGLNATAAPEPWETRETSRALATSADRTAAARRYTSSVSTTRGGTMQRQGERALDLLHPQYVQRFALAARRAHAEGIPVGIYSAYRPPRMGVGGFKDKYKSTHAYGIGGDVSGIGRPGSKTARRWHEIATEEGLINPYGPDHRKEWNHYQLVPQKSAYQIPGLRDTITGEGPIDVEEMWAASGVDPDGVPYAGDPFGVSRSRVAAASPPAPRMSPRGQPRMGAQGGRQVESAYAPQPEAQAPFEAVERPGKRQTVPLRQAAPTQAPVVGGAYVVKKGDTLSAIAKRELGDANRWQEIAEANGITDPRRVQIGTRLAIPGRRGGAAPVGRGERTGRLPATPPSPRMRPSREVDIPQPRPRPERGADVPTPRMRPQPEHTLTRNPAQPGRGPNWRGESLPVESRSPPVASPRMSPAEIGKAVSDFRSYAMSRGVRPGPVLDEAVRNYALQIRGMGGQPAGPGMDASGLIREPTAEERALPMVRPNMTGNRPMDPAVAAQVRRIPAVIVDPQSPPVYVSPSGVRVWAVR